MGKYSREPLVPAKAARARGKDLRVHYKNTFEVGAAVRGMNLLKAKAYLRDVLEHKQVVPFRRYSGGVGRSSQAKAFKHTQGRWPEKSVRIVLALLENAEANAEVKGLKVDNLVVSHIQVNQAAKGRRRTYRAHGRINPYLQSNCHVELFVAERTDQVKKAEAPKTKKGKKDKLAIGQAQ